MIESRTPEVRTYQSMTSGEEVMDALIRTTDCTDWVTYVNTHTAEFGELNYAKLKESEMSISVRKVADAIDRMKKEDENSSIEELMEYMNVMELADMDENCYGETPLQEDMSRICGKILKLLKKNIPEE